MNIKEYGKKDQIITRITKHYSDNKLGIFSLEDYVNERNHSSQNDTPPINSLPDESNSDEASSPSCSAYTQHSTVDDVTIEAEEGDENEEEDEEEVLTKKRKVSIHPIYIVDKVCTNENEALEIITNEACWHSYCISNKTKDGTKSYYGCKYKKCTKKVGLWHDLVDETV